VKCGCLCFFIATSRSKSGAIDNPPRFFSSHLFFFYFLFFFLLFLFFIAIVILKISLEDSLENVQLNGY